MREGEILSYHEHVKVAYSIFLAGFHMWRAWSWRVRSGCINHVLPHHIPCAGGWKPLPGHSGGAGEGLVEPGGRGRGLGNGGKFGKAEGGVRAGGSPSSHGLFYCFVGAQGVKMCSFRRERISAGSCKTFDKILHFCENSNSYISRICWIERDIESKRLEPAEVKKSMWKGENPSKYSSLCPKIFLIDFSNQYNIKKENIDADFLIYFFNLGAVFIFGSFNIFFP